MFREGRYLWMLLALLMSATVFEGYDVTIFHLCTPDIARSFHLDDRAIGLNGLVRAFWRDARVHRRDAFRSSRAQARGLRDRPPLHAVHIVHPRCPGDFGAFTIFQSGAQIFLSAGIRRRDNHDRREFPDSSAGRGVRGAACGRLARVVAGGLLYGHVADSRWGWRGMYFIGILPLLLVAFLRRGIRETLRFEAYSQLRSSGPASLPERSRRYVTRSSRFAAHIAAGCCWWRCCGIA